jgi:hypothetical protein
VSDLFLSILRGFRIELPRFGDDGTAPLPEVLA